MMLRPISGTDHLPAAWWFGSDGPGDCLPVFPSQRAGQPLYPFRNGDLEHPFRCYGWALLRVDEGGIAITWDTRFCPSETIESLCGVLERASERGRVRLNFFWGGGWAREDHRSRKQAIARLQRLMDPPADDAAQFVRVTPRACAAAESAPDLIRSTWQWFDHGSQVAGALSARPELATKLVAFAPNRWGRFGLAGLGMRSALVSVLGRAWARDAVRGSGLPDRDYDAAVSESYAQVIASGDPELSRVTAAMESPQFAEPIWVDYLRLLVPVKAGAGLGPSACESVVCATSILSRSCAAITVSKSA